jgi:hypothetical protein
MSSTGSSIVDRCSGCGYTLTGITSSRCPECGRPITAEEPIDRHRERQFEWRREFTLYADRVLIRGKRLFGARFEVPIRLGQINPDHATFFIRPPAFRAGFSMFAIGATFASFRFLTKLEQWPQIFCSIAGIMGLCGLIIMICTFKCVEFIRFESLAQPGKYVLDIGRKGPDSSRFDEFVARVRQQIAHAMRAQRPKQ